MSQLAFVQIACLVVFGLLLLGAAWQDWRTMRIADALPLAIIATYVVWAASSMALGTLSLASATLGSIGSGILFSAAMVAFAGRLLGGGDVKLLAAASLFAGPDLMADFLLVTALAGGVLGIAVLAGTSIGPILPSSQLNASAPPLRHLAYGPAIAAGGLWIATLLGVA